MYYHSVTIEVNLTSDNKYFEMQLHPNNRPHVALVVSPLRALMKDQQQRWSGKGIATGCILPADDMTKEEKKGIVTVLMRNCLGVVN